MSSIEIVTKQDLEDFKKDLFAELRALFKSTTPGTSLPKMLKSYEVRGILNISPGTLAKLRANGTIPFVWMGDEPRYSEADIQEMLLKNKNLPAKK